MTEHEKYLHFTVLYRGKPLQLKALASSTLDELGKEIVHRTGVAPHTLRLMLPKRPPLQPMSEQQRTTLLSQSGITEGLTLRMMGVSSAEVATVSQPSLKDRILGFSAEEERARQRSSYAPGTSILPKGNYIFCNFQTLRLPNIELNPPPAVALKIMHRLASDRGISAIMNKYHWRVGVLTEMAPIGYVGISPKCILGFNKNRGQEISLRLRTDDLKGFRKYESIKKTLLHELAHMVHDEHDDKFHALDKQLNEEAIALDWTKSHGHVLSGVKYEEDEEAMDAGGVGSSRGYRLGGNGEQARFMDARTAAAAAAIRRLEDSVIKTPELGTGESSKTTMEKTPSILGEKPAGQSEPDPDEYEIQSMVVIAKGAVGKEESHAVDNVVNAPVRNGERGPNEHGRKGELTADDAFHSLLHVPVRSQEPDPDEASSGDSSTNEPDPDDVMEAPIRSQEPDPDEASSGESGKNEPDPDEALNTVLGMRVRSQEPDPDEASAGDLDKNEADSHESVDIVLDSQVTNQEPGPDEVHSDESGESERDSIKEVDTTNDTSVRSKEPDPGAACRGESNKCEPDPDEAVDIGPDIPIINQGPDPDESCQGESAKIGWVPDEAVDIVPEVLVRSEEPDPDEACNGDSGKDEPDPVDGVDIVLCDTQAVRAQKPDPHEGSSALFKVSSPVRSDEPDPGDVSDTVSEERDLDSCLGCSCVANKRMKSGTASERTEFVKSQVSR